MERAALSQAERAAHAGRQWWWAARGRGSRRGGWRLRARVELRPTWALAVRFCKRKKGRGSADSRGVCVITYSYDPSVRSGRSVSVVTSDPKG
jgi:hypothetical protein